MRRSRPHNQSIIPWYLFYCVCPSYLYQQRVGGSGGSLLSDGDTVSLLVASFLYDIIPSYQLFPLPGKSWAQQLPPVYYTLQRVGGSGLLIQLGTWKSFCPSSVYNTLVLIPAATRRWAWWGASEALLLSIIPWYWSHCKTYPSPATRRCSDESTERWRNASVGLVGCSYAGSLATWSRRAAPHLIDVAFSDSGPVRAQEDFPEYLEVITSVLETQGGAACVASVRAGMEGLVALLETSNGPQRVSEMFNTCAPLTPSPLDLATFFWFGVTETFAYLVQYATPGDIEQACAKLTDASVADPTLRLAPWVTTDPTLRLASWVTSQSNAQPCIEARYAEVVAAHTNTSYDAEDSVMRLWTYQLCVDYGWWQTTSSSEQPFLSAVPIEYFHQMCQDFYSSDFTRARTTAGIARTNLLFSPSLPDRVVSVAGTGDPWSPAGPSARDATALAPVLVVEGVSHCRAIRPTGDSETEQLEQAKNSVKEFLKAGLKGEPLFIINSASGAGASLAVAVVAMFVTLLW
ncbi:unnamed protein product [Plutella xylostella]|uniref:(diamondback moth) hypothetical protein n=1 Tax=Plutella xylostella TaxID=51655 RepID=A0A8S4G8P4_PLUXY|nr:unnamed protein product [Plutella xylostella]